MSIARLGTAAAWAKFNELGMPARNSEEWVRTDIRLFKLDRFSIPTASTLEGELPSALLTTGVELGGAYHLVDG